MNLEELVQKIRNVSDDKVVQGLANLIADWKNDPSTTRELADRVERYIGNSWIESGKDHSKVYTLWSSFRDEAISGIGGMTMNERLYWFCLFDRFDSCADEHEKKDIYRKLEATP
jgi:ATP-dependent protease HslVU (ClpYQ) peptidase subunit